MTELALLNLAVLWCIVLGNLALTIAIIRRIRTGDAGSQAGLTDQIGLEAGAIAPDFEAHTSDGQPVRLTDYRGVPTVLFLMSPDCPPCIGIAGTLARSAARAADRGEAYLVVSLGSPSDARRDLPELFADGLTVVFPPDGGTVIKREFRFAVTPSYCAIDADGLVVKSGIPSKREGSWRDLEDMFAYVRTGVS